MSSMVKRDSLSESSLSNWMNADFGDRIGNTPSYRPQQKVSDWLDSFK